MIDDEIALLKQKENVFDVSCYQAKSNLDLAVKNCTEKVADLGSNICKIHDHVTNSMTNVRIFKIYIIEFYSTS